MEGKLGLDIQRGYEIVQREAFKCKSTKCVRQIITECEKQTLLLMALERNCNSQRQCSQPG